MVGPPSCLVAAAMTRVCAPRLDLRHDAIQFRAIGRTSFAFPRRRGGDDETLEGSVLFIIGYVALAAWGIASLGNRFGLFAVGEVRNVALLVGLMCLFVAFLKARDAALRRR